MVGTSNLGSWNGYWAGPVLVKSGSLVVNFNDAFYILLLDSDSLVQFCDAQVVVDYLKQYDKDGKGALSREELQEAMRGAVWDLWSSLGMDRVDRLSEGTRKELGRSVDSRVLRGPCNLRPGRECQELQVGEVAHGSDLKSSNFPSQQTEKNTCFSCYFFRVSSTSQI